MEQIAFEQRLTTLWRQGSHDVALSFLRRALSTDNTLSEVLTALQFAGVQEYLGDIRLKDVLSIATEVKPTVLPPRVKRKRRTAEELDLIRDRILSIVTDGPGSVTTTQICEQLQTEGLEMDALRVSLVLKTLKTEEWVVDLGGRPKAWRAGNPQGKRVAEPMMIKKKQVS